MKTKMFFLAGICAALAACSSDSDDVSSSPSNAPAILEVVSYKFVQEETDVVERVEYPVVVLQHKVNAARKSKVDDNTAKMQSIKWLGV